MRGRDLMPCRHSVLIVADFQSRLTHAPHIFTVRLGPRELARSLVRLWTDTVDTQSHASEWLNSLTNRPICVCLLWPESSASKR